MHCQVILEYLTSGQTVITTFLAPRLVVPHTLLEADNIMNAIPAPNTSRPVASPARTVLVLGAAGGIGGETARQLHAAGWHVRAWVHHRPVTDGPAPSERWSEVSGDARSAADVLRAAAHVHVIVHAVNPPGYRHWAEHGLPMLDHSIAAARATGARLVLPGNLYGYGPEVYANGDGVVDESTPQNPITRKGAVRVEMEQRLRSAAAQGVRSLILRCGDFFGPRPGGSWLSQGILQPGRPVRRLIWPGRRGTGHSWAYLPDVAAVLVRLLARETELQDLEVFHFGGHWDGDGNRMLSEIRRAVSEHDGGNPAVWPLPWPLIRAAGLVSPFMAELAEMRDLWRYPLQLNDRRLRTFLGDVPITTWPDAVSATLRGLGCLEPAARPGIAGLS